MGGARSLLALDWTEFDGDDHATLAAYVVTTHGRATPLAWQTVKKSTLGDGQRTEIEHALIERLAGAIDPEVAITLLADRGFGDQKLYSLLAMLGWDFVIRFRGSILVEHEGVSKPASAWLPVTGRATRLRGARVTADRTEVGAVVVVRDKRMAEPWYLATSAGDKAASFVVKLYGRRFTIEETFRDQKDLRFGMGLRATHIRSEARRDRLLMLLAIAQALLTLARRRVRTHRHGRLPEGQHQQEAHALALSPGHATGTAASPPCATTGSRSSCPRSRRSSRSTQRWIRSSRRFEGIPPGCARLIGRRRFRGAGRASRTWATCSHRATTSR